MKNFHISSDNKTIPQTKRVSKEQKRNSAGGFSFKITPWQAFERFLILGIEDGTFYTSEKRLAKKNIKCLDKCLAEDPKRTIELIVVLSVQGRVINEDTAIFALAYCAAHADEKVRILANQNTTKVLRTFTHLAHYMNYSNELRNGMGSGFRKGVAKYYTETSVQKLGMHMLKYRQRDGWTHKDLLRITHPKTSDPVRRALFQFATQGIENMGARKVIRERTYAGGKKKALTWIYNKEAGWREDLPKQIEAFIEAQELDVATKKGKNKLICLIQDFKLTHEMIPTEAKKIPAVWEVLAQDMPLKSLLRNLSTFGRLELLEPLRNVAFTNLIVSKLQDKKIIKYSKLHPLSIFLALREYKRGESINKFSKNNFTWKPVNKILAALNEAFYSAFDYIEPTNKNFLLAIDCSGSMDWKLANGMSVREAAALMAMVTARVESNYHIVGFSSRHWRRNSGIENLDISPKDKLDDICHKMQVFNWGCTDCSLPFVFAKDNNLEVDAFCVYTDNETWIGDLHPHVALQNYRKHSEIPAISVVVGMTATSFSIADPNDAGMLDLAGFDPATPRRISEFVKQF